MTTVRQLLSEKGDRVHTVSPGDTVYNAIRKMADEDIGSLLVMDDGKIAGIITERHYARNVMLKGRASPSTLVKDIMETNVLYVRADQSVEECMAIMTDKKIRHLPVMEGQQMIGLVSIGDLVKNIISDQKFIIDQLEHFIRG